ncbi:Bug family tripartite tricarboxylate transporter substrate binding protein [Bordetella trematum]|uniref:Bug family tripartite tricarboxylate transporter substrate binding protein n=1 Tax=Bordetella trematum TaxID=123899 RepID=UPI0013FDAD07|nr:tripartite tricarboxylate transporter substrate binding protein [Bordetella trematum]
MRNALLRNALFALSALALVPAACQAQAYPQKLITIVVPFPAGGTLDNLARTLGQKMGDRLKQPVIIDNKPGGGTMIGTERVARAQPDGYVLGMVANSFAINPSLHTDLRYDTQKDFAPVSYLAYTPHILVAHPDVPVKTLQDLITQAGKKPDTITMGSFGNGTSSHIAIEQLKAQTGAKVMHVPYKGQAAALTDLLGGHVDMMFANVPDVLPHITSGKLRAIAVVNDQRLAAAPDVPTFKEAGLPDFKSNSWYGAVAPAGTPAAIVELLSNEFAQVLALPEVRTQLAEQGLVPLGTTPQAFSEHIKTEIANAAQMVKQSGATAQ